MIHNADAMKWFDVYVPTLLLNNDIHACIIHLVILWTELYGIILKHIIVSVLLVIRMPNISRHYDNKTQPNITFTRIIQFSRIPSQVIIFHRINKSYCAWFRRLDCANTVKHSCNGLGKSDAVIYHPPPNTPSFISLFWIQWKMALMK